MRGVMEFEGFETYDGRADILGPWLFLVHDACHIPHCTAASCKYNNH
jgi:hypothetical protein